MDFEKFRRTGELSDITVIVDKKEFKLHTFPLFIKSDYFKKAVASSTTSAPYVIRLDNDFPGGAETFDQLADYFYSIPITIDQKNIVPLRSAAAFIQCDTLATSLDKRFNEILLVARAKYDLAIPLLLLEQCVGEYQHWAKETHIVDKCLQSIVESLSRGASLQLNKSDRDTLIRLPLEWMIELIKLCPTENKLAILPLAKHYITIHVLDQNQSQNSSTSSTENGSEQQTTSLSVTKNENIPVMTNKEKRDTLDQIVKQLGNTFEKLPLSWLNAAYEKAVEFKCECESTLSSYIIQAILNSSDFDENMENIPDDVMARLLERVSKHKEEHVKDPHILTKVILLYIIF
jgi:exonuclease VII small subunit